MLITKTSRGSYRIEKRLNGYLHKCTYIGYTLAEAKQKFRDDYKIQLQNEVQK
jgi:hypothetical protein